MNPIIHSVPTPPYGLKGISINRQTSTPYRSLSCPDEAQRAQWVPAQLPAHAVKQFHLHTKSGQLLIEASLPCVRVRRHPLRVFVPVRNHRFYPVDVRAETSQLDLLALAGFDRQRVSIHPLVGRHLGRLRGVGEDIEDGWLVDNWQKGHTGHDLLEDGSNLCLNFFLRFV